MEERNIRWGELVGGLLIVGCSIALVVSLWSKIEQIEILKFFIFTSVTAALFGVGLYTEHRWKLPLTSRGVLIIATLLVPLNFLAIAKFSEGSHGGDLSVLAGEGVALVLFAVLLSCASLVIAAPWPWLLAGGMVLLSVAQIVIRRMAGPDIPATLLVGLAALPLVVYQAAVGRMLQLASRWTEFDERRLNAIFVLLGLMTFAVLSPFGLLLYLSGHVATSLRTLSPLVSLAGIPALGTGLLLWRRLASPKLPAFRTAGTSIAIVGALVLVLGAVLAWPAPADMLAVAGLDFVALSAVAVLLDLPVAHLLAVPCLALAYLVAFHLARGSFAWHSDDSLDVAGKLLSAVSGTALAPLFVALALASEALALAQRAGTDWLIVSPPQRLGWSAWGWSPGMAPAFRRSGRPVVAGRVLCRRSAARGRKNTKDRC